MNDEQKLQHNRAHSHNSEICNDIKYNLGHFLVLGWEGKR